MVNKQQTAVEWMSENLKGHITEGILEEVTIQAKQMEKEQMCECYNDGLYQDIHSDTLLPFEQYYNETFKSE